MDRLNPSIYDVIRLDPSLPAEDRALELAAEDMQRWSRRYLQPVLRYVCLTTVWLIVIVKRILPFQFSWHRGIDLLGVWFMRRCVSAAGMELLIRHFIIESIIINFIAENSGAPDVIPVKLFPTKIEDFTDSAVIQHDLNTYNLVLDLGKSESADVRTRRKLEELNFGMLDMPEIEVPNTRWLNLDLLTGLYLMNIMFCLLTTDEEYERAVVSFQLDESMMIYLADMTGDDAFRRWTPLSFLPLLSIRKDVPRDLYWHSVVHEFALGRLRQLRDTVHGNTHCDKATNFSKSQTPIV